MGARAYGDFAMPKGMWQFSIKPKKVTMAKAGNYLFHGEEEDNRTELQNTCITAGD